jgi:CO/xanthine dehydrogenase Mo-binding subunit
MDLKVGVKKDGIFCALQANYFANTGAYTESGPGVFTRALLHTNGPYHFPNMDISIIGVFTNNPSAAGMRGFGVPQVALAIESHIDQIAQDIGLDPWEIRYRNAYTSERILPTGHKIPGNVEIRKCLEVIKPYYDKIKADVADKNRNSNLIRYGVGLATTMYGIGQTGILFPSRVRVYLEEDGTLVVRAGVADVGQGAVTGLAQIAADEFGAPFHRVKIFSTDTLTEPDSGPTAASRQIFFTGKVVCSSLKRLKKMMLDVAPLIFERRVEKITLVYSDEGTFIFPDEDRRLSLPISEFMNMANKSGVILEAEDIYNPGITYYDHKTQRGQPYPAYTYAAQVVEVSVNEKTSKIEVLRAVVAQDVGRAINPKMVEGQLEGSILMGIGWALKEKFVPGETESFATYPIPRTKEVPEITTILVENDEPGAPFGAKGVAEAAMVPTAPAILNAIADATGIRLYEIPVDVNRLVRKKGK